MRPGGRKKGEITHRDVCRAVAKIGAYLRCGDRDSARQWAHQLVDYLVKMEVYPAHCAQIPTRKQEGIDEKNA